MSLAKQHPMIGTAMFAVVTCMAAVSLVGCGSDDDEAAAPPSESASGPSAASPAPSQEDTADDASDLIAAGKTALQEVDNSTVISIESEDNGTRWEVQVVTSDGTEYEMDISSDGSKLVSGPRKEDDEPADKAKHRDRVKAAKLDYEAAAKKLLEAIPGGRITELNLDTERGRTVWEADVIDDSDKKHEVDLDASSGKVLADDVSG